MNEVTGIIQYPTRHHHGWQAPSVDSAVAENSSSLSDNTSKFRRFGQTSVGFVRCCSKFGESPREPIKDEAQNLRQA